MIKRFLYSLLVNICFWIYFTIGIMIMNIGYHILAKNHADKIAKLIVQYLLEMLRRFFNIQYKVENLPNLTTINTNEMVVYASKHQSVMDVVLLYHILELPAFVVKESLIKIPMFGNVIKKIGSFGIKRENNINAAKTLIKNFQKTKKINNKIVIFPEGTRINIGEDKPLHSGIHFFYKMNNTIRPIALNSGKIWPNNSFLRAKGTITVKFLPTIEKNLTKEEFMQKISTEIKEESKKLL